MVYQENVNSDREILEPAQLIIPQSTAVPTGETGTLIYRNNKLRFKTAAGSQEVTSA